MRHADDRWHSSVRAQLAVGRGMREVRDQQDLVLISDEPRDVRGQLGVRAGGAGALLTRWDVGHNFIDVHPAAGPGRFSAIAAPHGTVHNDSLVSQAEALQHTPRGIILVLFV